MAITHFELELEALQEKQTVAFQSIPCAPPPLPLFSSLSFTVSFSRSPFLGRDRALLTLFFHGTQGELKKLVSELEDFMNMSIAACREDNAELLDKRRGKLLALQERRFQEAAAGTVLLAIDPKALVKAPLAVDSSQQIPQ